MAFRGELLKLNREGAPKGLSAMIVKDVSSYPTVIEENESYLLPFLLVGGCLLLSLYFWRDSVKFYGSLLAAGSMLLFCVSGHRKVVVHRDKRTIELFACRLWGDKLEHTLSFDDVVEVAGRRSWGASDSDLDYKAHIKDRYGRTYQLMTGWKLIESDAEAMVASVRSALGMSSSGLSDKR